MISNQGTMGSAIGIGEAEQRRNLRLLSVEGGAYSVMVGVGETYLAALVIAAGMGDFLAGMITTVPVLLGSILQLCSPWGVRWLGSNRNWSMLAVTVQALSLIAIAGMVYTGRLSAVVLFMAATLYWAGGLAAGPAWNAWVEHLVPPSIRPSFFGFRGRICQICVLFGILAGGGLLRIPTEHQQLMQMFAGLFAIAGVCRLASAWTFAQATERPAWRPRRELAIDWTDFRNSCDGNTVRLMAFLLSMQTAVFIAAPFFTPFMLTHLKLSYVEYTWLIALSFGGKILAMPGASRFAVRYGADRLLCVGALGIVPLAGMWFVSRSIVFLSFVQLVGGIVWAFYELATILLFFERIPHRQRVALLSLYNLGNAVAMTLGSLIGGLILMFLDASMSAYLTVFLVSMVGRFVPLIWMPRYGKRATTFADHTVHRVVAVRPSIGAWLRPVIPTFPRGTDRLSILDPPSPKSREGQVAHEVEQENVPFESGV